MYISFRSRRKEIIEQLKNKISLPDKFIIFTNILNNPEKEKK
jgi:hypothetical protein